MAETMIALDGLTVSAPTTVPFAVLRVRAPSDLQAAALSATFGLAWPVTPNTAAESDEATVLWLAPGEWAVTGMEGAEARRRSREALGDALHHVANVTDGRVVFRISGARSQGLLAQGCGLDLHPRTFAAGACAQTLFAQTAVLIHRSAEADAFHLSVDATLSGHLRAWFARAAPFAGT